MAKQNELFLTRNAKHVAVTFVNADGTTLKDVLTGPADDCIITDIAITSSDSAARDLLWYLQISGTDYLIGHIDIPANSGFDGTVNAVNGFNATNMPWLRSDSNGNKFLKLGSGVKLRAGMKVAATAATTVAVVVNYEEF